MLEKNKFEKMSDDIQYHLIGTIKINPDIDEPLKEFKAIYYRDSTGEISSEEIVIKPISSRLSHEKDKKYFEEYYGVNINFEVDYSKGYAYVIVGSKIDYFEVLELDTREASVKSYPEYITKIHYKDGFDGNVLYVYWIEDDHLNFCD